MVSSSRDCPIALELLELYWNGFDHIFLIVRSQSFGQALRALALTGDDFRSLSTRVFHRLATQLKSTQVE